VSLLAAGDERGLDVDLYALHEGRDRLVMIEKYESEQARSKHLEDAAAAGLRSALEGRLSHALDAQVLVPHPAGSVASFLTPLREAEMSTAKEHSSIPSTAVEFAPGLWRTSLFEVHVPDDLAGLRRRGTRSIW
jgi:hypothetical protein